MVPEQLLENSNQLLYEMITITGKTKLVGLIGQPVSHSLSPIMHNAAYEEMGLDWCYLAMQCEKQNLEHLIEVLRFVDCIGLNVTIPHKQEVIKTCNKLTKIAEEIQAVNTLIPEKNNQWIGANTDVEGFLKPLKSHNLMNKNVIIIGCGGSARAVVMGLKGLNIKELIVIGRNKSSLDIFIKNMKNLLSNKLISIKGISNKDINIKSYIREADLIINTTPIGMNDLNIEQDNIPLGRQIWDNLSNYTILYDLIYTPRPTKWLKLGQQKDCFIIDGLDMLVEQGALSIRLWSGFNDVPIKIMKSSAEKHLMV